MKIVRFIGHLFKFVVILVCKVVGGVVRGYNDGDAGLSREICQVLLVLSAGQRHSPGLTLVLDIKKVGVAMWPLIDVSWFR